MGINRANKRKCKSGCGCKMCKPHKGKWAPAFKRKDIDSMNRMQLEIEEHKD
jgi:hypothetical protein